MATAELPGKLANLSVAEDTPGGRVPSEFPSGHVKLPPLREASRAPRSPQRQNSKDSIVSRIIRSISHSRGSQSRDRSSESQSTERPSETTERGRSVNAPIVEETRGRTHPHPIAEETRGRTANSRAAEQRSASVQTSSTSRTRSASRGRLSSVPPAHFGGRGGAGNAVRSPSRGRQELHLIATKEGEFGETDEGIEEEDWEEPIEVVKAAKKVVEERSLSRGRVPEIPVGRGGMGGMRSGSKVAPTPEEAAGRRLEAEKEREVEAKYRLENKGRVSYGRGGSGNHQG